MNWTNPIIRSAEFIDSQLRNIIHDLQWFQENPHDAHDLQKTLERAEHARRELENLRSGK